MNDVVAEWIEKAETVSFRYPGEMATKEEARAALKAVRAVRTFIRQKLPL